MTIDQRFMMQAIELATANVLNAAGGPFGCVIVREGKVIATGANSVTATNDPTAHAEVTAIRAACKALNTFQLTDCDVYTSCEPCPMCLAAIYWARCRTIYCGNTAEDAAAIGFDDRFLYDQMQLEPAQRSIAMHRLCRDEANASFKAWSETSQRIDY